MEIGDFQFKAFWRPGEKKWTWLHHREVVPLMKRMVDQEDCFLTAQSFQRPNHKSGDAHYAPFFLDLDDKEGTGKALEDARRVIPYLSEMGCDAKHQSWVSTGGHGFHCYVPGSVFDAKPSPLVTQTYREMAKMLSEYLKVTTVDLSVYAVPHLMRVPGCLHKRTGIRSRWVSAKEILESSLQEILGDS